MARSVSLFAAMSAALPQLGHQRKRSPAFREGRSVNLYSVPQYVVLPLKPSRGAQRVFKGCQSIRIHIVGYEFPRISLLGNSVNRGNGAVPR